MMEAEILDLCGERPNPILVRQIRETCTPYEVAVAYEHYAAGTYGTGWVYKDDEVTNTP